MSINPAKANGLMGCTPEQMGIDETGSAGPGPLQFDTAEADCPDASKIGTAVAETPLVEGPVKGTIYVATPSKNPFHSQLALYLVFDGSGFTIKLAVKVEANPQTGQLTATTGSLPQLPLESLSLNLFNGPRAPLSTPQVCGEGSATSRFVPWSAPASGPPESIQNVLMFDSAPGGGSCPQRTTYRAFAPALLVGSLDAAAAASSSFILRVSRSDGDQELKAVAVKLPRGLVASLQDGGSYCSDAEIAHAEARSGLGGGILERDKPSCPADSRVGSLLIGAGTGSVPLFFKGVVYLAGPYKGAPFSLVMVTPAVAGGTETDPLFDRGAIVFRVALDVDPRTAQISARSDVIPRILDGIPLRIKDIRVLIDRPGFLSNPSSCEEMKVPVEIEGWESGQANLVNRFQMGGCQQLGFQPRLDVRLVGSLPGQHPKLRAVLKARPGDAGISRTRITLPRSESLDRTRVGTVCPESLLVQHSCPPGSVYGHVTAWSPLLGQPLEGSIYLTSTAKGLPDLVLVLEGQLSLDAVGKIRSEQNRVQITFTGLPDVPLSKLVLSLRGARKGFLVNSRDLCGRRMYFAGRFTAHNGRVESQRSILGGACAIRKQSHRKPFTK